MSSAVPPIKIRIADGSSCNPAIHRRGKAMPKNPLVPSARSISTVPMALFGAEEAQYTGINSGVIPKGWLCHKIGHT